MKELEFVIVFIEKTEIIIKTDRNHKNRFFGFYEIKTMNTDNFIYKYIKYSSSHSRTVVYNL